MDSQLTHKHNAVKDQLSGYDSVIVAFSGGIDSSLVAYLANEVLGDKTLAVTSGSASLKRSDLMLTQELAAKWAVHLSSRIAFVGSISIPFGSMLCTF